MATIDNEYDDHHDKLDVLARATIQNRYNHLPARQKSFIDSEALLLANDVDKLGMVTAREVLHAIGVLLNNGRDGNGK